MTRLKFVGDLPLWLGLLLATLTAVLAWRYYRRESFDLSDRLRWVLPTLRSLAFFLGIMVFTGPVLHHRQTIGEPGNVRIYVDASQSMGMLDRHLSVGRKLLIAEQQGWLEVGRVDTSALQAAEKLTESRQAALELLRTDPPVETALLTARDSLKAALEAAAPFVAGDQLNPVLETLTATNISSETLPDAASHLQQIANSSQQIEQQLQAAFESSVRQQVESGDSSIQSALALFDETPRWRRAERSLLVTAVPLFETLRQHHNVDVLALENDQAVEMLSGRSMDETPDSLQPEPIGPLTDLASALSGGTSSEPVSDDAEAVPADTVEGGNGNRTAIVLISDGQHNFGSSPLQAARILGGQGIPVHTVVLGANRQAPDLAVTGLEHPDVVFQKDRIRGTMIVRDRMPVGQPLVAEIQSGDDIVWSQHLVTDGSGERRIDFEFPIEEIVERLGTDFSTDIQQHAVPLTLTASVAPLQEEAETDNNAQSLRFAAITESHRLLVLDGRSRWETRYLRNAFDRDTQWDINVVMAGPGTDDDTLPRGNQVGMFPETREALFDYDLIVIGEILPSLFHDHEFEWIREFAELRGGGVIFIDGQREHLHQLTDADLSPLLPVEFTGDRLTSAPAVLQLTESGSRQTALSFEADVQANRRFWTELPVPHRMTAAKTLPGAEVLVEALVDGNPVPALVTRTYGAGRIIYMAFDETWRWRYQAADTYHQRFWNQLAGFTMPRPFAASDDYLSIDTGPVTYRSGDSADVRIQLKDLDGRPAVDVSADALLWKDGRLVGTSSLTADGSVPGLYRGNTGMLEAGDYEVSIRAAGFSDSVLKARGRFTVQPPDSLELAETSSNESLLKQMADASGGTFLREEQTAQLADILSPLSSGRIVPSDTPLWQSYWCFVPIIILLTLEWMLRKRAGLL
ncbi:MAG: hypothetical protein R3C49_08980 [Planctomycetaceae bacterium]